MKVMIKVKVLKNSVLKSSDSLDVALRVFNLVGGAQSFSELCGTQEIVNVFSEKSQKALGVYNNEKLLSILLVSSFFVSAVFVFSV